MSGLTKRDYDAIVVGAGPNGLAAAVALQQAGLSVLLVEGKDTVGGGTRSAELTLPGFTHDICSAIHPLAVGSPFFRTLPLGAHGLEYIYPDIAAAHPFDDGTAAVLRRPVEVTARSLGADQRAYLRLIQPVVEEWPRMVDDILAPFHFPRRPAAFLDFGFKALAPAAHLAKKFKTRQAKGLWAGMAAHGMQPLSNFATSAVAMVLLVTGHFSGWPVVRGGTQRLPQALASYFTSLGGKILTNFFVRALDQLPTAHAVLFDVTPRQLLEIAGHRFTSLYRWQLRRYRYGMGVFKVDWALDGPTPFTSPDCRKAGTVHLGGTYEEIAAGEKMIWRGKLPEKPFVLFAQQSVHDPSRAPRQKQTAWAYCHVPNGSTVDMTAVIEKQVERYAPGFRERILGRHTFNAEEMEFYNPNYAGGDINGGVNDVRQLFTRPALRASPYRTSCKGIYICSSSTPPGGGVHGMCGFHAARRALKDVFGLKIENKS